MKQLPPQLLAISPGDLRDAPAAAHFLGLFDRAVRGGLRGILLREPCLPDLAFLELARQLRTRLDSIDVEQAWLGVHDRVHIALASNADGIHLGFRSLPIVEVAAIAGDRLTIGLSTHAGDEPESWAPADYLFHGPVRSTPSKAGILEPIGTSGLKRALEITDRPIWALGGLRAEDVSGVLEAGVAGVAVLSGVFGATDVQTAVECYRSAGCKS